ncbi:Uncharacterised protein [Bordetella pertussis]|nr:Uncharacterised protein [Bordetella pertussis]
MPLICRKTTFLPGSASAASSSGNRASSYGASAQVLKWAMLAMAVTDVS